MVSNRKESELSKGKEHRRLGWPVLFIVVVMMTGMIVGLLQVRPPSPPTTGEADYPAYQRMLANLKAMTKTPHPSGSKELEAVRAHLLQQIKQMGLIAKVEEKIWTLQEFKTELMTDMKKELPAHLLPPEKEIEANIRERKNLDKNDQLLLKNILVKVDAPQTDRGILVMAHYDSDNDRTSHGAADDMVSVTAMLEAIREQSKKGNLKKDLYFLFTDGEELGTLGAKAFVKAHPELKKSIDMVLNWEARGNRGGLLMFETSAQNAKLLQYLREATSRPIAFSFTAAIYRMMPNGTDLTTFLNEGYSGLNFAVAEGIEHYHQASDNFQNLNRGSAYHFLLTISEMVNHVAQTPLHSTTSSQDAVYFPFFLGNLVLMSEQVAYILSGVAILLTFSWLVWQIRSGRIHLRKLSLGTVWSLGMMLLAACISGVFIYPMTQQIDPETWAYSDAWFMFQCFLILIGFIYLMIQRFRKQTLTEALAGILLFQLLLIVGTTIFFHAISYLFTLPTLGLLLVAILEKVRIARKIASVGIGIGILLLYVPVCWLVYVMLLLPVAPISMALSVIPISMITAIFVTQYQRTHGGEPSDAV